MTPLKPLFVAALLAAAQIAHAAVPAECSISLLAGQAPITSTASGPTHTLCFLGYATVSSGATRTPLWSAEHLTVDAVTQARSVVRDSKFHEELSLPTNERATLADYARSGGWDRGHMAPSGDFPDHNSQEESFTLANVVPQSATNNRGLWSHLETSTRKLVRKVGEAYVVTGPAFTSPNARMLNGRVRIPDYIWKAIYIPNAGAAAYIVRNDATQAYATVSIAELSRFVGVDPFPALPTGMRDRAVSLPAPSPHPGEKTGKLVTLAQLTSLPAEGEHPAPEAGGAGFKIGDLVRMVRAAEGHR